MKLYYFFQGIEYLLAWNHYTYKWAREIIRRGNISWRIHWWQVAPCRRNVTRKKTISLDICWIYFVEIKYTWIIFDLVYARIALGKYDACQTINFKQLSVSLYIFFSDSAGYSHITPLMQLYHFPTKAWTIYWPDTFIHTNGR